MRSLALALHAALVLAAGAADAPPSAEQLTARLAAESWHARERAAARLLALGEKARPALEEALDHPDPEVRHRARQILARLRWHPPDGLPERLADAWEHYHLLPEGHRIMLLTRMTSELGKRAAPVLRRVLRHDSSEKIRRQAVSRLTRLDPDAAEEELRRLADEGAAPWAAEQLARHLTSRGKTDQAIEVYEAARRKLPDEERLAARLAYLYQQKGQWAKARDLFAQLVQTAEQGMRKYGAKLGRCHLEMGQRQKAEQVWRQMLRDLGDSPHAYQMLARAYESAGNHEMALQALREGCKEHPRDFGLLSRLGQKLASAGKHTEAADILEKARRTSPSHYQRRMINNQLARVLKEAGDLEAYVRRHEQKLAELDREIADILRTLVQRYLDAGNRASARRTLARLVDLFPDSPHARWARSQLEALGGH